MKHYKAFIPLFLFVFVSCSLFQLNWYNLHTLQNDTEHSIKVIAFERTLPIYDVNKRIDSIYTFTIVPNGKYEVKQRTGEDAFDQTVFQTYSVDSVILIFDNEKALFFSRCDYDNPSCIELKNPLNLNSFESDCDTRKHGCDYTYTITEEDYEMAAFIKKE